MISTLLQRPTPIFGVGAAVSLLLGVSFVQCWPALPHFMLSMILLCVGACAWWRVTSMWRCLGVFAFAIALACLHGSWSLSQRLSHVMDAEIVGTVKGLPISDEESTRFEFTITESSHAFLIGKQVRLSIYGHEVPLKSGARWRFQVSLKPPRGVLNPGGFDFERRALEHHIAAVGHVKKPEYAKLISQQHGMDAWREHTSALIASSILDDAARFVQALVLGDTRQLSDEDWLLLRAHGLTHLIAISGFHVGLVAGFAALFIRALYFLWPRLGRVCSLPQGAAFAAMLAAFMYTMMAGFALPTWRTCLMISVIALARISRRHALFRQSIALSLIVILVLNPLSVLSAGFWLSFIGVIWLALCMPSGQNFRQLKWRDHLRLFLQSQWVALVGLLPLSIWFFGQTSLLAPISNLIAIPLISLVIVPLALLGLLSSFFYLPLATVFWKLSAAVMDFFWQLLLYINEPKSMLLALPEPSLLALTMAMIGGFILLHPRAVPGKTLSLCLFLPLMLPNTPSPKANEVDISLIDVGQGLSLLVKTQHHALLYDAGPGIPGKFDRGESIVIPTLQAIGVRELDSIVISHGDLDHAGGLTSVRRYFSDAEVLAPEGWRDQTMKPCLKAQRWQWDGVAFEFLHPPPHYPYQRNESSCVLRIQTKSQSILLTGDIGQWVEKRLINEQATKIDVDVLLVPHHGSQSSSSSEFIHATSPKLALIASGADNRFHHPRPLVLARYESAGIETAGSVENGFLRFRLHDQGITWLDRRRLDQPRYWHHRN
jgi:competence protein ComEC